MKLIKKHLNSGRIQAYLDRQIPSDQLAEFDRHLADCSRCRLQLQQAQQRSVFLHSQLSQLDPIPESFQPTAPKAGFVRLSKRLETTKEVNRNMKTNIFPRIPRPVWAVVTLVLVLAVALAFEPVRVFANSFLALFRAEQIQVVQFDPDEIENRLENSSRLEYMLSNDVQVEEQGESHEVASADDASSQAGFSVKLPATESPTKFLVQPGARMTFTVNLELVRGVLKDLERDDIQLPDGLDGAVVQMELPTSVISSFGDCKFEPTDQIDPDQAPPPLEPSGEDCKTLVQVPSPVISAPPDLDLTKIGEAYLQVLGMDSEEAAAFSRNVNWASTFVIPLPRYYTDYEEVDIDGSPGTLIHNKDSYRDSYVLVWIEDGIIYALSGEGDTASALETARSIE